MRAALGLVGVLMALGIGYAVYTSQIQHIAGDKPLKQEIDMVGIQSDLLSLAQAEKLYMAAHGTYASIGQLRRSGIMNTIPAGHRSGYEYSIETDGSGYFRITAAPGDSAQENLPVLSIDETLQISR